MPIFTARILRVPALFLLLAASPALAHHGWSWAQSEQMTLEGTVESVAIAPPHPMIQVRDSEGKVWQVDLGNPRQTQASGFTPMSAQKGDAITVLGNRSRDEAKPHMKAVRVTIAGRNYDMYPERLPSN